MGLKVWHGCLAGASALLFTLMLAAPAGAQVPVRSFFENPPVSGARLSPTGRYLALRTGGYRTRDGLSVMELDTGKLQVLTHYDEADVDQFMWISDERLVYNLRDRSTALGNWYYAPGLYAVNRDGSNERQLVSRDGHSSEVHNSTLSGILPFNIYFLDQAPGRDGNSVYALRAQWDKKGYAVSFELLQIDTLSGNASVVPQPATMQSWLLDAQGRPRLALSVANSKSTYRYLHPGTDTWRVLASFDAADESASSFAPVAFGPDGKLLVSTRAGGDKLALRRMEPATGELEREALVALPAFDFSGEPVHSNGKLLGYEVLADGRTMAWLDQDMKAVQKHIDTLAPGLINLVTPPLRPASPWLLVRSYSDQQPMVYMVYRRDTGKLTTIGATRPAIRPDDMAQMDLKWLKARDGLPLPAWLTLPKDRKKNLPMVVLVHGGPWQRGGELQWNEQVQFLASRGYAVLQPEFRGSTGYGDKHFRAGLKQWGLAMQDDVADAARWAIEQGIADPKRICIAGGRYGGYSALMGLLKDPQLFKCGVNWGGWTDLALMQEEHLFHPYDLPDDWLGRGMPALVGDVKQDAAQLAATSPLQQASRIRQPLLMAYTNTDFRVPLSHGRRFHTALKAHNPQAELMEYGNKEHSWDTPQTKIDFWIRVEKFLARHIGPAAKAE
jgi:dipeptidyl aminopeptidase/acylaminoacyl peptidase